MPLIFIIICDICGYFVTLILCGAYIESNSV